MTDESRPSGRSSRTAGRLGLFRRGNAVIQWPGLPYLSAGIGVVLVVGSVLLLSRDRALPQAFGAIPGTAMQSQSVIPQHTTANTNSESTADSPAEVPAVVPSDTRPSTSAPTPAPGHATVRPGTTKADAPPRTPSTVTAVAEPGTTAGFPERIVLPSQQVDAAVLGVATSQGTLQIPPDPADVGWWVGSALPGSQSGTTVLAGHIDSATAGIGAFWKLAELGAGATVSLQLRDGRTVSYVVVARRVYPKGAGLPATLFRLTGPPTLLLISCGGPFDSERKSYEDNIAVFATPQA